VRDSPESGGDPLEQLGADEVRSRAAGGAALLGARGALIYAVGIVANLVLARLLVPRDFGVVALGTVLVVIGGYVADGGFGGALIQRERAPTRLELEAVFGVQLCVTLAFAIVFAGAAATFGREGLVVAAMAASLPIAILRMPSLVVLERRLQYRVVATADVLEAISYYAWAIGAVALGLGVWGLATAVVVRAVVGSATVLAIGPLGPIRPRWSWSHVRPLLGFGLKYQATGVLQIVQQQGLNIGIAAVAGVSVLGVWSLAWRVLQVPVLLFISVNRVVFPSMSRLLAAGAEVRPGIERGVATLAVLTGAVTVPLVGLAPFLPTVVGDNWGDVPEVILWSGIALVVTAPITVTTGGYLFAAGAAGVVAGATLAGSAVWFGLSLPLLPSLGPKVIGMGWVASGIVYASVLWRATSARSGAVLRERLVVPTVLGLAATGASWLVADVAPTSLLAALAAVVAGETILLAGLAGLSRSALADARSLLALALGAFRPGRAARLKSAETTSAPPGGRGARQS
jgi:O-antigen/teichoic acid export membrane protein